jgi:outer membrane protein OmpA-like peptidoglycan-associated protein
VAPARAPSRSSAPVTDQWTLSGDVLFDSGSATLSPSALSQLSGIVLQAKEHPGATIDVVGYTDDIPDPTFLNGNLGLSVARANAVAAVISSAEIAGDHISASGVGTADPLASNDTAVGRQQNRRVTITLVAP